ncbi:MAG: hypothetical protein R3B48_07950 [Kofleriaceae bacterium]
MTLFVRLALTLGLVVAGAGRAAADCTVDPGGALGLPGGYPTINAALADPACLSAGVINVVCQPAGCTDTNVLINGLSNVTIRALEVPGVNGPAVLIGTGGNPAVVITNSSEIAIEGFSSILGPPFAVWIDASKVNLVGPTVGGVARYLDLTSPGGTAMKVNGDSQVDVTQVGFHASTTGLELTAAGGLGPSVTARAVAFLDNGQAVDMVGPAGGCGPSPATVLNVDGDGGGAWLNYVMRNVNGFRLRGRSSVQLDHTVLASNLYTMAAPGNETLFAVRDASRLEARNALIYDNDAHPGLTGPFAGGFNTGSVLLDHTSCDQSSFIASTVINNAADITFGVGGSGRLVLDHTLVAGNWGKTLSMSSYYVAHGNTCPPLSLTAAAVWGNKLIADPVACLPPPLIVGWNPNPIVSASTPRTIVGYPTVPAPWTDLYLINHLEPFVYALPVGLFLGRPWSVDALHDDVADLDVGYHNPH